MEKIYTPVRLVLGTMIALTLMLLMINTTAPVGAGTYRPSVMPALTATPTPVKGPAVTSTAIPPKAAPNSYDVLSYIAPLNGSQVPVRSISDCRHPVNGRGCGPQRVKSPIFIGGANNGGSYKYTNTFYMLKDDASSGQGGWTTFEKYGYDDQFIWIMRDGDWGSGTALTGPFPAGMSVSALSPQNATGCPNPPPNPTPNGSDYNVIFTQNTSVADGSGLCQGCFFNVPAGYVSRGLWAKRSMALGEYVDDGFQNHNLPGKIHPFYRDRTTGAWQDVDPCYTFSAAGTLQLYAAGTQDFGGVVGTRDYIVLRRFVDGTHPNPPCYPADGCPYVDERYWYARDIGLVRFEIFDYGDPNNPDPQVTWGNAASDFGPVWDLNYQQSPVDPAYDHVYVNWSGQMASKHSQLFFMTNGEPWFSEDKSVSLDANNDPGWYTYDFNFSGNPKWKGTITGLRFDPTDGPGAATWYTACGCLGWQRIRLGTETKSSYSAYFDITGNQDTQGFSLNNMWNWGWIQDANDGNKWKWLMQPTANDPWIVRTGISVSPGR